MPLDYVLISDNLLLHTHFLDLSSHIFFPLNFHMIPIYLYHNCLLVPLSFACSWEPPCLLGALQGHIINSSDPHSSSLGEILLLLQRRNSLELNSLYTQTELVKTWSDITNVSDSRRSLFFQTVLGNFEGGDRMVIGRHYGC